MDKIMNQVLKENSIGIWKLVEINCMGMIAF